MILATIHFFLFFTICFGNGSILFSILNIKERFNVYEITLIGLIITGLIAQLLNFFIPLNNSLIISNFFIIILFFTFNNFIKFKDIFIRKFNKIIILLLIVILFNIWCSDFHDDLNHYHYSYILNTDYTKYIFGYNFFHNLYGFSSGWLILQSYFNFDYSRLQDIHVINALILFLVLCIFISHFNEIKKKENIKILDIIFFSILLFVILKYTRLKEFGLDKPATLIFFYIIFLSFKNEIFDKKLNNANLFIILLLSFFIIYIKIIYIPILILPVLNILKFKNYGFLFTKYCNILILVNISYFAKNIIISGCLVYPVQQLCFENLTWINLNSIQELGLGIEVFNKSYSNYNGSLSKIEYIQNFNWIATWFLRNFKEFTNIILLIILCFLIPVLISKRKYKKSNKDIINLTSVLIFCFLSFILFLKSPVIRMYHHFFVFIILVCSIYLFKNFTFKINKKFIFILTIALVFNFSKNFIRIHKADYNNDHFGKIIQLGWYTKSIKSNIGQFEYYIGWYDKAVAGQDLNELKLKYRKTLLNYDMIYK